MRNSTRFNRHLASPCEVVGISLALLGCSSRPAGDDTEASFHALAVSSSAIYTIAGVASGRCVQIAGQSLANSARAQLATCSNSASQQFQFPVLSGSYYHVVNVASGKCLDVQSKSTANGAAVIQYTCGSGTNQQWAITNNPDGSVRLTARHSGKVMEANQGGTADGTYIVQWTSSGAAYQEFKLAARGTAAPEAQAAMVVRPEAQAARPEAQAARPEAQAELRPQAAIPLPGQHGGRHQWWRLVVGWHPTGGISTAPEDQRYRHLVGMLPWLQPISTLPTEQRHSMWKELRCSAGCRTTQMGMRFSQPIRYR